MERCRGRAVTPAVLTRCDWRCVTVYHDPVPPPPSQPSVDGEARTTGEPVPAPASDQPTASIDVQAATHPPLALNDADPGAITALDTLAADGPHLSDDRGLYAVLGLAPTASGAEISTAYRRQAARLLNRGPRNSHAMRELNVAYEVLGNPLRRAEYDRLRMGRAFTPAPTPLAVGPKVVTRVGKRTRPRQAVQPHYAGLPDVLVVLIVVGLAVVVGALLIPRLSVNLSALNALQGIIPNSGRARPTVEPASATRAVALQPTPTVRPGLTEHFNGSTVSVSDPTPAQNGNESVQIHLRRDGAPAANLETWALVQYRTTQERWPIDGAVKTDSAGAATITFNVGGATPGYPVTVRVYAQVDDQQLTWSTSFTPR